MLQHLGFWTVHRFTSKTSGCKKTLSVASKGYRSSCNFKLIVAQKNSTAISCSRIKVKSGSSKLLNNITRNYNEHSSSANHTTKWSICWNESISPWFRKKLQMPFAVPKGLVEQSQILVYIHTHNFATASSKGWWANATVGMQHELPAVFLMEMQMHLFSVNQSLSHRAKVLPTPLR